MARMTFGRRRLLQGAATLATAALAPRGSLAQQAVRNAAAPGAPLPPRGELIIRGATVLTMDPAVPDIVGGDVHVRDGAIVAVAQKMEAPAARVIDGAGMICIPGFIDTHFHMWTSVFRPFVRADVAALGYFPVTARLGPLMAPEDSYRAVRLGAVDALSAGITTLHNWAHNTRSPEHADAELAAMRDGKGIHAKVDRNYRAVANKDNDYLIDRAAQKAGRTYSGVEGFAMQDASVQESMGPIVDRTKETLVSTDSGIIMARQRLLRAIKALAEDGVAPPGVALDHQRVRSAAVILPPDQPFKDAARESLIVQPGVAPASV